MHLVKSLAVALSMYSKIPVPAVEWKEENMKYAMCFFPVVGVAVGILQYLAAAVLLGLTDCGAAFFSAVMTLIPVLVTGGIHLDGFADTTDALASWGSKEKKLEILKDPHTGAFAVIGLCCWFLFTFALWSEVPGSGNSRNALAAVSCMYVLSRALSGISVVTFPAAKNSGLLRTFQDSAHKTRVRIVLFLWAALAGSLMCLLSPVQGAAMLAAAAVIFLYYYRRCKKQFGGTTGDLAGYFLQLCELGMLAAFVLAGGLLWK